MKVKLLPTLGLSFLVLLGLYFLVTAVTVKPVMPVITDPRDTIFSGLNLEARAAVIYDLEAKEIIFSKNPEAQLPIASLTKLMTALLALERSPTTPSAPGVVEITPRAINEFGDDGFLVGDRWSIPELIKYTLVTSSNDGAQALAGVAGAALMNQTARDLELAQTYFANPTGLDYYDRLPGAYSSARDLALLFEVLLERYPDLLLATTLPSIEARSLDNHFYQGSNTNLMIGEIPGLLASKTGFTDTAQGNLAIIFDRGLHQPLVAVVLNSSAEGRFEDMRQLVARSLAYFSL